MEYIAEEFYYLSLILNKVLIRDFITLESMEYSKIYWILMIEELN